jgi:hypothetical protein
MTQKFRSNLPFDKKMTPIFICISQNIIYTDGKWKYLYGLYAIDLNNYKILCTDFVYKKPNGDVIISLLKKLLTKNLSFGIVALKSSPFFNEKVQAFFKENKILYYYYNRDNVPPIGSVLNAYVTRMLELHIDNNAFIHYQYVL